MELGQTAILRSIEILQNMGCDMRVLQMEGAKDPDEYVIKYGNVRFQNLMEKALSLVEYKVKILKKDLNLENTSDKIKFLNEIAKIISSVDNNIEKEVYIENISKTYNISKEAIYAQVNKLTYSNVKSEKILEKTKPVIIHKKQEKAVSEKIKNREDTILSLLLNEENNVYEIIKQNVKPEDFKYEIDKLIAKKLYEEFEKGNSNISSIIDNLTEEEQNHVTAILAEDFEIENTEKAIDDLLKNYEKDKLQERKQEIMELRKQTLGKEEQENLLNELNEIIEGMRLNLPREVKQAQRIVGQAHSIIDKANSNGQAIIMEANEKAAQMISEEQIYKQAKAEAEALIEDAQNKANSIIKEASDRATQLKVGSLDYADKMLSNTETKIENLIKSITDNSESLKGYLNQEIDAIYEERQTLNTYYEDVYQEQ